MSELMSRKQLINLLDELGIDYELDSPHIGIVSEGGTIIPCDKVLSPSEYFAKLEGIFCKWSSLEEKYAFVGDENPSVAHDIAFSKEGERFIKDIESDVIEVRCMEIINKGENSYPEITKILEKAGWDARL